ncbi:hypothetical protein [Jannaschia sp. CCS1]|uniref:hypothetical protein n=1 Tax=Jannaschia sp. (strain CCS1) TaxID=290400 RepID=UPI000053C7B8|nr:hypothetical protein [Jannaschia sp. CCS1]ABD53284.1 hypothetical protein Jann_0367 [Jannaschia sp. CCS1]
MSEYLPKEIRDQLAAARRQGKRKRATRSVHVGDEAFAIIEMSDHGFALDTETAPRLRGLIDIYDGAQHLYQALIMASSEDGDLMRYDFKRNTATARTAPVDFVQSDTRPAGLLSKA